MGSVRGYRCTSCRGELLATAEPAVSAGRPNWTPPVLCCGQPLRPLDPDQVLPAMLTRGRMARCPRCGYQVRMIVHPVTPPVCMLCQLEFTLMEPGAATGRSVASSGALSASRR
jgi:DNA-directed RNA polymerase subunit RPC12/RpoP